MISVSLQLRRSSDPGATRAIWAACPCCLQLRKSSEAGEKSTTWTACPFGCEDRVRLVSGVVCSVLCTLIKTDRINEESRWDKIKANYIAIIIGFDLISLTLLIDSTRLHQCHHKIFETLMHLIIIYVYNSDEIWKFVRVCLCPTTPPTILGLGQHMIYQKVIKLFSKFCRK